ncbi:RES domain-containing protein [Candidatus Magnetomoraceae bacterium gMMP-15]
MNKFCCINCFSESEIKSFIKCNETIGDCDYCGCQDIDSYNVKDVGAFIMEGIERYYEDAANQVAVERGCYQLPTLDISEILIHEENIFSDFLDDPYPLSGDLIINDSTPYVIKNPYGPPPCDPEEIEYWENFCNIVKTQQRFTTFLTLDETDRNDHRDPGNFLYHLATFYIPSLIDVIETGKKIYRARIKNGDKKFDHKDLTSPPAESVKNNRMSPSGISFFYGAIDPETCIHEVRPDVGEEVVVGEFKVLQNLFIVDLTYEIENRKSIFDSEYEFSCEEYFKPFLSHFVNDISKPIRKSDNEIEYIPTQVFTEFIKNLNFKDKFSWTNEKDEELDVFISGIIFKSSIKKDGKNIVLFRGPDISLIPQKNKDIDISLKIQKNQNDQWLSYKDSKNYLVNEVVVKTTKE